MNFYFWNNISSFNYERENSFVKHNKWQEDSLWGTFPNLNQLKKFRATCNIITKKNVDPKRLRVSLKFGNSAEKF